MEQRRVEKPTSTVHNSTRPLDAQVASSLRRASADNAPTFPGYVVFGDRQGPCHAQIIIDGDTGEIPTEFEIGD